MITDTQTPKCTSVHAPKSPQKNESQNSNLQGRLIIGLGLAACAFVVSVALVELAGLIYEMVHERIWKPDIKKIEEEISHKFDACFIEKIKNLPEFDYIRFFKRLAVCKEDEQEIFNNLITQFEIPESQLHEILKGAHVRLDDDGQMYQSWIKKISGKKQRISSHPADTVQYGIRGPVVKELLFSCITENDKKYTWFQLENHPVTFGHILRHMLDYFKYKLTKENQGPYGSSKATDKTPLLIAKK